MTFEEAWYRLDNPHQINGWLTQDEARLLWDAASATEGHILEVGSYMGRSTVLLAALGRPVHAVDPFNNFDSDLTGDQVQRILLDNLASRNVRNVCVYRNTVEDWYITPCGFAYLDGDHTEAGTTAQIVKARMCGVTAIAVHDVNDHGGGREVKKACINCLGEWTERVGRLAVWRFNP